MNERGQIVIPKATRNHFGFSAGQRLVMLSDDNEGIVLIPAEFFEQKLDLMGRLISPADE